ncbi:hypothetical protein NDU88_008594 [Pleurodeles waltl]|uniref:Uncharacterized protein n=1 Tax=Pleurodeles waltl TaxID=8319 RepID=A0AAV7QS68_PLEWA|nr:hypothetical protein NDU88_008594 [Pleurodeles waltl]
MYNFWYSSAGRRIAASLTSWRCRSRLSDLRGIPALGAGEEEAAGCRARLPRIPSCAFPRHSVEGVRALPVAGSWAGPTWIGGSQRLRLILHAPVVRELGRVRRREEVLRPQQDDYSLGLPRRPQPVGESYRAPRGLRPDPGSWGCTGWAGAGPV